MLAISYSFVDDIVCISLKENLNIISTLLKRYTLSIDAVCKVTEDKCSLYV